MLISKIRLSNFKNFDDVEVDLGKMNVFVGANASGKSNFLQALKFIRDIKDFGIENAISLQGGVEYLRNVNFKDKKKTRIAIDFQPEGGKILERLLPSNNFLGLKYSNITYFLEISYNNDEFHLLQEGFNYHSELQEVSPSPIEAKIIESYESKILVRDGSLILPTHQKDEKIRILLSNNQFIEVDNEEIYPIDKYLETRIIRNLEVDKTLIEQFPSIFPMPLNLSIYDFDLKNAKKPTSIIGKADLEENGENLSIVLKNILEDKEKARQFSNLLSDILPFIKGIETEKYFDKSLSFKVKEAYNSIAIIPSSLLSDGTISITAILTALFFQKNRMAIFEEPEHGVHPALIAKLMQFFYEASNEKQIIITTHSPEILKHTQLEDLRLVNPPSRKWSKLFLKMN
ncbi:MAG: AAA family ATPase [Thermoflexibacter sp.]|nr:AAA family ATPase [Thermoflexibacter sp.]